MNELIKAGVSMILTEKGICPNYRSWYSNIMARSGVSDYASPNCKLVIKTGSENHPIYLDVSVHVPIQWGPCEIRAKILHNRDNTKSLDIEKLGSNEWLINKLPKDYFSSISFVMLIMKV